MRILVCGGRNYANKARLFSILDAINIDRGVSVVIHGACPYGGADILAEGWAKAREIPYYGVPAKFKADGRRAGPMRNDIMLKAKPKLVVAFEGGKGTADMITKAERAGVEVLKVLDEIG